MSKLDLPPAELLALAQACRIAAKRTAKDADRQLDPTARNILQSTVKSYLDQAEALTSAAQTARISQANASGSQSEL